MPVSGLFTVRYPPPIPWSLLYFRSLVRIEHSFPMPGLRLIGWPAPLTGLLLPRKHLALPSSQATPVTACPALRPRWCPDHSPNIASGPAAFRYLHNVGFCPVSRTYPMTTMSTISGLNPTACSLVPSGFGLPLPGLPADFTTDLLAKLWSGGTLAVCDHPLGNNVEFHGLSSSPNDLGLTWRE